MVRGDVSFIKFVTKNFLSSLDNIDVTEIGRNFPEIVGQGAFGTGITTTSSIVQEHVNGKGIAKNICYDMS